MSRHVHADIIKAWLDGKEIEIYRGGNVGWKDHFPMGSAGIIWFCPSETFRIKPEVPRYKVAVFSDGKTTWVGNAYPTETWEGVERWTNFSHWATEPFTLEKK